MQRSMRAMVAAIWVAALLAIPVIAQDSVAVITSPSDGQPVSGLVPVYGTASSTDFGHYELAFGTDPNPGDSWSTFAAPDIVLVNAQIGLWDANLPPGTYALRLRVFRADGSLAVEDFVNGLTVGTPPTEAPAASPTGVPPAPTFETETQPTPEPTEGIEQPPTSTPTPIAVANTVEDQSDAAAESDSGPVIDLSRFGDACINGVWCAVGAYFLLAAFVGGRFGIRWIMKQVRERENQ